MFDLRWIRDNPDAFDRGLARRGVASASARILELDAQGRAVQTELQALQSRRNAASKDIGKAMTDGRADEAAALKAEVTAIKSAAQDLAPRERALAGELDALLSGLPNILVDDVPDGPDEAANVELRRVRTPPDFAFDPKAHDALGEAWGLMDFETAGHISGARFVVLKGALARLERALGQFMIDVHTREFGYTEVSPPLLVRSKALYGTGQLPKLGEDMFRTADDYWLIPTAEVTLTNLAAERIFAEDELPLRVTALTSCFRSEAGAAGKDTRGMLRQHQFYKVELVSIVHPDNSEAEHERMIGCAEEILNRLGLAYRAVVLSSGDTAFAARKTVDLEVWLPGQERYREISSCSNCWDFQARRMQARFRPAGEKGTRFVHTLNGSGVAVGRALIALLENYQQADGAVVVPDVLRPYMGGTEVIGRDG